MVDGELDGNSHGDFKGKGHQRGGKTSAGSKIREQHPVHPQSHPVHKSMGSPAWCQRERRKEPPGTKGRLPRLKPIQRALVENRNCNSLCRWLCMEASPAQVKTWMCSQKMLTFCSPRSEKSRARQGGCSGEIYN